MKPVTMVLTLLFAGGTVLTFAGCEEGWEDLDRPEEPLEQPQPQPQPAPEYEDPGSGEQPMFEDDADADAETEEPAHEQEYQEYEDE